MPDWLQLETDTYQDHVIAHVRGATVLGYFTTDEAVHLLLDIGLLWTVYVDAQMALGMQRVELADLLIDEQRREGLKEEAALLQDEGHLIEGLEYFVRAPRNCLISEVCLYECSNRLRLVIEGEESGLLIEMSPATGDVSVQIKMGAAGRA